MKFVSYNIKEIPDEVVEMRLTNEYPYLKTIITKKNRWIIQKKFFNFFILDEPLHNKYFNTPEEAEIEIKKITYEKNHKNFINNKSVIITK